MRFKVGQNVPLLLYCEFSLTLSPLSIFLKCENGGLTYYNDKFYFQPTYFLDNSKITFSLFNYTLKQNLDYKLQLTSLEGNESDKPELNEKDNQICLQLNPQQKNEVKIINALLEISLTEKLKILINI